MKRAALYIRVSTDEQAKHGLSISSQRETLRNYAETNGYEIAGEFVDDGVSGQKGYKKRPALNRLMQELDNLDVILFIRLDRWFRSVRLYYEAQDLLERHHVTWRAILEDYETETASGIFKVNIMLSVAQAEAQRTSEKIRDVFENKRARGEVLSGSVSHGLKIVDKHLVANPEEVPMVIDIFNKYVELRSRNALYSYISDKYGIQYTVEGLKYFLTNRHLLECGVVPEDLFNTVQDITRQRSHRRIVAGNFYLFTGLATCAECGYKMRASHKRTTAMYGCAKHSNYGNQFCGNYKMISERKLEKRLKEIILSDAERHNINLSPANMDAVKLEITRIKQKIKRLQELYVNGLIDIDAYKTQYAEFNTALQAAEQKVNDTSPVDVESMRTALELYEQLTPENKRAFWHRALKAIYIDREQRVRIEINKNMPYSKLPLGIFEFSPQSAKKTAGPF